VIAGRRLDRGRKVAGKLGEAARFIRTDVSGEAEVKNVIISPPASLAEVEDDDVDVPLKAPFCGSDWAPTKSDSYLRWCTHNSILIRVFEVESCNAFGIVSAYECDFA
jgi:hypothetical protein